MTVEAAGGRFDAMLRDARAPTDVEALLRWAIGRELADAIVEAAERERDSAMPSSGWGWCESMARLGVVVQGAASSRGALPLHADAEHVYRVARGALDGPALMTVRHFAKKGTRPDWNPFPVISYGPLLTARGKRRPRVFRLPDGREFCKLVVYDHARELVAHREIWMKWHDALKRIESALLAGDVLTRWRLVLWREPREPWMQG
jgi:hypothetical protein